MLAFSLLEIGDLRDSAEAYPFQVRFQILSFELTPCQNLFNVIFADQQLVIRIVDQFVKLLIQELREARVDDLELLPAVIQEGEELDEAVECVGTKQQVLDK